jgi:predicted MFS family arabinose efflux permease
VLIFLGMVLAMTSSLGAPLVPTIGAALHVSADTAQWSLTAALVAGALSTPTLGRLSDGPHRRPILLTVLVAGVAGNVLAATANTFGLLVAGRVLQGIGLGLMPMAIAVASEHLPAEKGRSTVAILSVTGAAGVGIGYPLTGLVALHLGYRSAFWVGAGVAAVALILATAVIPASPRKQQAPFDIFGVVLLTGGLLALLLAISQAPVWGWTAGSVLALFLAAVVLLASWFGWELHTADPLVQLRLLRNPWVMTADAAGFFAGIGMYLLLALLIRYVETPKSAGYGYGSTVFISGLVILPLSIGSVVASRIAPRFAARFGTMLVIPVGSVLFAISMTFFLLEHGELWTAFVTTALAGLGLGFSFAAMPGMIIRAVPASETGSATSVNQLVRSIGYSVGSALSAVVLSAQTPSGAAFPRWTGYRNGLLLGIVLWLITAAVSFAVPQWAMHSGRLATSDEKLSTEDEELLAEESGEMGGAGLPYRS